jgi:hypothetical protein
LAASQGVGRPNPLALNHLSPNYFKQLRRFRGLIFWGGKLAGLANFQTITILKTAGMPDGEAFGMEKVAAFEACGEFRREDESAAAGVGNRVLRRAISG